MKKPFVLVLCTVMVLISVLTGCNAGATTPGAATTAPTPGAATTAPEQTQQGTASPETSEPAQKGEPVTLLYHRGGTADYAVDESNPTYQRLMAAALEQANVNLKIELFDWGDTYNQKLTMYAASGGLPSGVWTLGGVTDAFATEIVNKMGESGMLYDWTDVVNDTASYPTLKENAGETFLKMAIDKSDGKLYGLPAERHGSYPHAPGGITIRKDWLEKTGLSYPTNETELYNLIVKFKETFKNSAGKDITPVNFNGFDNFTFWLNSWLGTSLWYKNADGTYDYGKYSKQEQLAAALKFLNKLWNEGLLDKEAFTQKQEQFVEKGSNGSFGVTDYSWGALYTINDAFYATNPDTNMYFVSAPTFSCYDGLSANDVNSMELTSIPFNRTCITTEGIDKDTFLKLVKAIDWIGTYDASRMLLLGFEGSEWETEKDTNRIVRTASYNEKVAAKNTYQYNAGLCYWSSLNSNIKAMYDLLNCICTRKADVESVTNIKGHQIALSDPVNIVSAGEKETEKWPLIQDAWQKMVIAAISAPNEAECLNIVNAWPDQLKQLGYEDVKTERLATVKAYGLE